MHFPLPQSFVLWKIFGTLPGFTHTDVVGVVTVAQRLKQARERAQILIVFH
jgi:hypothetical protein